MLPLTTVLPSLAWLSALLSWKQPPQVVFTGTDSEVQSKRLITPELTRYVDEVRQNASVKGLTLAIVHPNGTEFGAWGDRTEYGDQMSSDTSFILASCSKAFLATSIGVLMDDYAHGKNTTPLPPNLTEFDWETKVKDILPDDWQVMDEWANEKANMRDILSHVSGIPRHDFSYSRQDSAEDLIRRLKYLRPAYELRQQFSYNNIMYMLGTYIITTYAESYPSFVKKRIFEPLNMTSSTFSVSNAKKMTQVWSKPGRRIPIWLEDDVIGLNAGPGGVISNVIDMSKWVETLLNAGVNPHTNETIIPKWIFDEITTAHSIVSGKAPNVKGSIIGYGMGWFRSSYLGHEIISHAGAIPGFTTLVSFLPSDGVGVVVFINNDGNDAAANTITTRVIEDVLDLGVKEVVLPDHSHSRDDPVPDSTKPTLDYHEYAGTYSNIGYGAFTLCDSTSDSFYCTEVREKFSLVDERKNSTEFDPHTQLLGAWPRLWTDHVRLTHLNGDVFNIQMTTLFPYGYGEDKSPFETYESGARTHFVVEDGRVIGFGVLGVGGVTEREKRGTTIQEKAEVWFGKV